MPEYKEVPTPFDVFESRRSDRHTTIRRLISNWTEQLKRQRSGPETIGTIGPFMFALSTGQEEAVRRFQQNGWTVKIRALWDLNFLPIFWLTFASADSSQNISQ
jgi:hypothetical protein